MNPSIIPDRQKKQFLRNLSEDEFRDKVVRPLLLMKGMRPGKDICGVDEDGKDCYMFTDDSVRRDILYAIQTKKGDIKMMRSAKDNLLTALTQVRTALATSVKDAKKRATFYPDCVLLVASGEINKAAQSHIVDEVKDPRVRFMDSDDLIPDIDKLMPEFWLGIDAKRLPYLRAFREYLVNQSDTIDMTQIGVAATVASPITDDTFVQLFLHRYTPKVAGSKDGGSNAIDVEEFSVQQLLQKPYPLAIISGEAGCGKTTSLRRLAMVMIDSALKSPEQAAVPIYIRATDIAIRTDRLVDYAAEITTKFTGDRSAAFERDDLLGGRVTLLIDGFDELATQDQRKDFFESLAAFHAEFATCRVYVTSRDTPYLKEFLALKFTRLRISPINLTQAGRIIDRISRGKDLPSHTTEEILRRLDTVHGIDLTPLLVTVFVATTDYARSDIPANITELFKKFTELMLGRWDQSKGLAQQYQANVKDFLLTRVAFEMHRDGVTNIRVDQFKAIMEGALAERGLSADASILYEEIVTRSGLVRIQDDALSFRHQLLQEFFAGRGIPSAEFMRSVLKDYWWMRAIVFYFGDRPGDETVLTGLPNHLTEFKGTDLYQASVAMGLAIQACYLARTETKVALMSWVIESMATAFDDVLAWFGEKHTFSDILRVVFFYLYSRDAIAARTMESVADQLFGAMDRPAGNELSPHQERVMFLAIAGVLGFGNAEMAEALMKKFHPKDIRLLLPIVLGCAYLEKVQTVPKEQKKIAQRIASKVRPIVSELSRDVIREMRGYILEIHGEEVKALDGHVPAEELEKEYLDTSQAETDDNAKAD